jgi:protein-S-isoprenylcysteine O-methyltransferase Ste14
MPKDAHFDEDRLSSLKKKILIRVMMLPVFMGIFFFLPAGSLKFWEAWAYSLILFPLMIFAVFYFLKRDPELLERRSKMREKEKEQKTIISVSSFIFLVGFLIPGFDYRFGWSDVPIYLVIVSDVLVLLGYLIFLLVIKENSYASRIIEVEENQEVITTGPYAVVRHPMYSGVMIMLLVTPLALGSFWAMVAVFPVPFLIVGRILNEERVLSKELSGYEEYRQKIRYRLIPFVW